jgi:hypothetical protein
MAKIHHFHIKNHHFHIKNHRFYIKKRPKTPFFYKKTPISDSYDPWATAGAKMSPAMISKKILTGQINRCVFFNRNYGGF